MARELEIKPAPIVIGAAGLEGLFQCLRIIVTTTVYSVPLDRAFAVTGSFIDSPLPHATARLMAELIAAVEKYEPRVRVETVSFSDPRTTREDLMEGRAYPILRFELREGVEL